MDKLGFLCRLNYNIYSCSNAALRILRFPRELKTAGIRKKNEELKTYKKSNKCYVAGLGPSLSGVDLSRLDGDLIATNRYHKFDKGQSYNPTFYCLMDGAFFNGKAKSDFVEICKKYPRACFVVNGKYRSSIEGDMQIPGGLNMFYTYMCSGAFKHKKKLDFTKIVPAANNVVNIGIYLALFCGYEEIYLLGCDFNSFASSRANHCYEEESEGRPLPLDYELYCYSLVARSHMELMRYAEEHDVKIYNVTKGSLLDAYPFQKTVMDLLYK